jgi:cytoskeletal protein CcmA (bactofilin family)
MNAAGQNGGNQFGGRLSATSDRPLNTRSNGPDNGTVAAPDIAIIGTGITITGNVEADVDLQIDGRVNGDVRCGTLLLSEAGTVAGMIIAERVRLSGQVEGGVDAADVAIEPTARVKGELSYSRLRISTGAIFEGTMVHRPLDPQESERTKGEERETRPPARVHHIE